MKSPCYASFVLSLSLLLGLLIQTIGQAPKNIAYRPKPKPAGMAVARLENAALRETLRWAFGGKDQQGWQLYEPLIVHFLQSDGRADTEAFAVAVSRWQQTANLSVTGVLDQETWLKLVERWQICRSKDRAIPAAASLVTLTSTEFYDPQRPVELRQVERETYAAYQRMVAAAAKDLGLATDAEGQLVAPYLKIISAFRSPEYQQKLRQQSPHSGRAGLAVNSPHFTGRALDLYVGGEPVSTKDTNRAVQVNTPVYRWLVKNAGRFGFIPYFYEPWHWEYNPQAARP